MERVSEQILKLIYVLTKRIESFQKASSPSKKSCYKNTIILDKDKKFWLNEYIKSIRSNYIIQVYNTYIMIQVVSWHEDMILFKSVIMKL